jgi:hypothetical protein
MTGRTYHDGTTTNPRKQCHSMAVLLRLLLLPLLSNDVIRGSNVVPQ